MKRFLLNQADLDGMGSLDSHALIWLKGDLKPHSPYGIWELSDKGRDFVAKLHDERGERDER